LRRVAGWLTEHYVVTFLLLIVLLSWWGERHWLFSLLLFAPTYVLLLPLVILTRSVSWSGRGLVLCQVLCIVVLCFGYMEFSWTRRGGRTDRER
jgi:hypothetical protein